MQLSKNDGFLNIKDAVMVVGILASIGGAAMAYGTTTQSLKDLINKVDQSAKDISFHASEIAETKSINREQTIVLQQISDTLRELGKKVDRKMDKKRGMDD